jgi:hypothetical protein
MSSHPGGDDVAQQLAHLTQAVQRLSAQQEIQNLMGTYTVNHVPRNMHDHVALFAMEMDDVSVEVGDRGVYVGPEAVRTLFDRQFRMEPKGNLLIHYLCTPMIEVAGDGRSARGVWRSPGIEAVVLAGADRPTPLWSFGAYAVDFIHLQGRWKIWHLHWMRTIKCRFDAGWVDDLSMAFSGPLPDSPSLRPTTYHNPYTPDAVQHSIPPCPRPHPHYEGPQWKTVEQGLVPAPGDGAVATGPDNP